MGSGNKGSNFRMEAKKESASKKSRFEKLKVKPMLIYFYDAIGMTLFQWPPFYLSVLRRFLHRIRRIGPQI